MPEFSRYRQVTSTESDIAQELPENEQQSLITSVQHQPKRQVILFTDVSGPIPPPFDIFMDIYARTDEQNITIAKTNPTSCYLYNVPIAVPVQYIDIVPSNTQKNSEDILIDWDGAKEYYMEKVMDHILQHGQIHHSHSLVRSYVELTDAQYVMEYLEVTQVNQDATRNLSANQQEAAP